MIEATAQVLAISAQTSATMKTSVLRHRRQLYPVENYPVEIFQSHLWMNCATVSSNQSSKKTISQLLRLRRKSLPTMRSERHTLDRFLMQMSCVRSVQLFRGYCSNSRRRTWRLDPVFRVREFPLISAVFEQECRKMLKRKSCSSSEMSSMLCSRSTNPWSKDSKYWGSNHTYL